MNKENYANKYAIISGVCFAAFTVCQIIMRIRLVINASQDSFFDIYSRSQLIEMYFPLAIIVLWLAFFGFAVFAIMRKKNIGLVFVAGVNVLIQIYVLVKLSSVYVLFDVLSAIALMFIISFTCIPSISLTSKVGIVKNVWFAPAILCALGNISYIVYLDRLINFIWILYDILEIASIFFIALWLESSIDCSVLAKKTVPIRTAIGGADILLEYKELFDSGIITQEEFDEKKKQIL